MKLVNLNLLKYGKFENTLINLPVDKLTIIYGPNETGKSTSLSAIADALYGFDHGKSYDFRFKASDLRVGGTVWSENNGTLKFVRKRGRSRTLLCGEGLNVLEDSALAAFLGNTDKDFFCSTFGLSHEQLRAGGSDIVRAKGDAGEVFLQAGSGLNNIKSLREQLANKADEIFAGRSSQDRKLYQSIERFKNAQSAYKSRMLTKEAWERAVEAANETGEKLEEIRKEYSELQSQRNRLTRLQTVLPILSELTRLREKARELGAPSALPDDADEQYAESSKSKYHMERLLQETEDNIRIKEEEIRNCVPDNNLLKFQNEIAELNKQIGEARSAGNNIILLKSDIDTLERNIALKAEEYNLSVENGTVNIPNNPTLEAMQEIVDELAEIDREINRNRQNLEKILTEIRKQKTDLEKYGNLADPQETLNRLVKIQTAWATSSKDGRPEEEAENVEKNIKRQLGKLTWWTHDLNRLLESSFPVEQTLEQYQEEMETAKKGVAKLEDKLKDRQEEAEEIREKLDNFKREKSFCAPDDVKAARKIRNKAWDLVEDVLKGKEFPSQSKIEKFERGDKLHDVYKTLSKEADDTADKCYDSVERTVEYESLQEKLKQKNSQAEKIEKELQERKSDFSALDAAWKKEWERFEVLPLSPGEMIRHLKIVEEIRGLKNQLTAYQTQIKNFDNSLETTLTKVQNIAKDVGGEFDYENDYIEDIIDELVRALDARRKEYQKYVNTTTLLANNESTLGELKNLEQKHQTTFAEAEARRVGLCKELGVEANLSVGQFRGLIGGFLKLKTLVDEKSRVHGELEKSKLTLVTFINQVNKLSNDINSGEQEVKHLDDAVALLQRISEGCGAAQKAAAEHESLAKGLKEYKDALERHREEYNKAVASLQVLMEQAGVSEVSELSQAIQIMKDQRHLEKEIRGREKLLTETCPGESEESLRQQLANYDQDTLLSETTDLANRLEALRALQDDAVRADTEARNHVVGLEKAGSAQEHAQEMLSAVAAMQEESRDYLRLKLASAYLSKSMEVIREEYQNPMLVGAGKHFRSLTNGNFTGLGIDYEKQEPVIVGIRDGGETVGVDGMSDGTLDQLYLSLRLAYLEKHCAGQEALPFIGDDLFVHFDNDRTAAGLRLLSELRGVQVILFTHHRHMADLATDTLADKVEIIDLGA